MVFTLAMKLYKGMRRENQDKIKKARNKYLDHYGYGTKAHMLLEIDGMTPYFPGLEVDFAMLKIKIRENWPKGPTDFTPYKSIWEQFGFMLNKLEDIKKDNFRKKVCTPIIHNRLWLNTTGEQLIKALGNL